MHLLVQESSQHSFQPKQTNNQETSGITTMFSMSCTVIFPPRMSYYSRSNNIIKKFNWIADHNTFINHRYFIINHS